MVSFVVDTASGQGDPDYELIARICCGAWNKVTEGTGYVDPFWARNKGAMQAAPLTPGAYMFAQHGDGAGQADYFAEHAGDLAGFGIFIDGEPERIGSFVSNPVRADIVAAAARLRVHYPTHRIGGYLPEWYWGSTPWAGVVDYLISSRYVLEVGTPGQIYPHVPGYFWDGYGGLPVDLLQFTSTAVIEGVGGLVDCSAFDGTPAEYAALVLGKSTRPPANEWELTMMRDLPTLTEHGTNDLEFVRRCQALLGVAGSRVKIDGVYGPATARAVEQVQRAHSLSVDGECGPHTWSVLITGADMPAGG